MNHILKTIESYDDIIIIMHIRPDGDAYGSSFGLKHIIEDNFPNKTIRVLGDSLSQYQFMGNTDTIKDEQFKNALVISLDTGARSRIADQRYHFGKYIIRIDHHIHVDPFGDYEYIDTESPATSCIITQLAMQHDLHISKAAAECLFVGIVTDTGRFKYRGVTAQTHEAVAYLIRQGIDQQQLFDAIYQKNLQTLKFEGELNTHLSSSKNGVLYAKIPREVILKSGLDDRTVAEFVTNLADIEGHPIWVLFYQVESMRIRARIRSKGYTVNKVAENYHGGGHKVAAGAVVDSWEEAEQLVQELDSLL